MKLRNFSLILAIIAAFSVSNTLIASNANCNSTFYAADESYYSHHDSEKIDVVAHAEPDLPPIALPEIQKKKAKSSTSFFSWLTKTHTMPSLHFIEFIELLGDDES